MVSLECHKCDSATSWKDCESRENTSTCPPKGKVTCVKVYAKYEPAGKEIYTKYCGPEKQCDKNKNPTCKKASECIIDCCKSDLCSAAEIQEISGIVLVAYSLALLVLQNL